MSASADPILIEKISHYRMAKVIVLSPATGPAIIFRGEEAVAQFQEIEKKLKTSADLTDPVQIGDKSFNLAPSLIIDAISGPVFWEEIVSSLPTARVG